MDLSGSGPLKSDINVTPLVDVMLVILIIFMLVTPMLQKGVGVLLPEARNVHAVSDRAEEVLTLALKSTGEIFLAGHAIERGTLVPMLRSKLVADPTIELQIKADRTVPYGEVKKLLLAGRDSGFPGAALIAHQIRDEVTESPRGRRRASR